MLKPGSYDVLVYHDRSGRSPFLDWLEELAVKTQERILARTARMARGQFGDFKRVGADLYELRLFFGPGYRVYFGERAGRLILLLNGGDKSTQSTDIRKATALWKTYLEDHP